MNDQRQPEKDYLKVLMQRQKTLSNISLAVSLISLAAAILVILLKKGA